MAKSKHPLWRKWTWIRQVINNPSCPQYQPDMTCVGLDDFTQFANFVEREIGPSRPDRPILNRLNKEHGWIPGNISWANQTEVAKSSDYTYKITYKKKTYCAFEFAALIGQDPTCVYRKLRRGRSIQEISGLKGVRIKYGHKAQRSI
jgi:hypothetical protein